MSASDFLKHTAAADPALGRAEVGVVNQRIRIQAAGQSMERTLYRDSQGHRRPRATKSQGTVASLPAVLALAGVDWDDPLSAASFANWHEHSAIRSDQVAQAGDGLLKLTTTVANSQVSEESLTVRKSDFHPVARTVEFHDAGTIEIAELDYSVSGWNAANDAMFDPVNPRPPAIHADILVPSIPSSEVLDEAELQARLAIRQDAGDFSEALHFTRTAKAATTAPRQSKLTFAAERNRVLCEELVSTSSPSSRPAMPLGKMKSYATAGMAGNPRWLVGCGLSSERMTELISVSLAIAVMFCCGIAKKKVS